MSKPQPAAPADNPYDALRDVCDAFGDPFLPGGWKVEPVQAVDLPQPIQLLLVHNSHMTSVLEEHYGTPVVLHVRDVVLRPERNEYHREITLTAGPDGPTVEFGVVRIALSALPASVAAEIVEQKRPLGEILIRHDVLRRVEPRFYYRFAADSAIAAYFGGDESCEVFGRVARIMCSDLPAIRMLEAVAAPRR
ncbi:hypothetical protein RAS1_43720 [Phycisphaerae bacterium RAS1]|nr:hypothetical protein RAS1_43720 [Phycisphaerae bacterium RAS1]